MMRRTLVALSAFALCALLATQTFAKDITVRGKLRKTVEAGGWLIVVQKEKYLILNSRQFQNEKWFAEGNEVEATGEIKSGVMTIYQEGTPFEAHSMRPFEQSESGTNGAAMRGLTRVLVTGDSIVQAQPDAAVLTISVVTKEARKGNQDEDTSRSLRLCVFAGTD